MINKNNNGSNNDTISQAIAPSKREKSILEIIQMILKHKFLLIGIILTFMLGAVLYSFTTQPRYEATAILKKENSADNRRVGSQDISTMLNLQSTDEIETEMNLIKTHSVMQEVVKDLDLFVTINQLKWGKLVTYKLQANYPQLKDPLFQTKNRSKFNVPEIFNLVFVDENKPVTGNFFIHKESDYKFALFSASSKKRLAETKLNYLDSTFNSKNTLIAPNFSIDISWSEAPVGSEINFTLTDFVTTVNTTTNKTKVGREGKTDIFNISYSSSSPYAAALIANTIVEKFRESRMMQKKEAIRFSFKSVDEQVAEVQEKLKQSENELSNFKSSGQLMTIDASSQEIIGFLSNLEAEKLQTDLLLNDYRSKSSDLKKEVQKNGYVDQTGLGPQNNTDANTPFSQLMRQLSQQELERLELLQKRTENHPDVIAINEQIKLTKSKLAGFNENTLTTYRIMINTLEKKLLKINNLMSKYEVKMRSLPSQENKLAQLLRQKGTYEKIFTLLLDRREAMRIAELSSMQDISIVDDARIPQSPSWPKRSLLLMISFILGTFLSLIIIFSMELYKTRFVNLDELESEFQVPILSIIPKYSKELQKEINNSKSEYKIASLISKDDGLIETFRLFRTKLLQKIDQDKKLVMITSCEEDSGKTSVVANLAISLSQEGKKILVVDCDLRKSDLTKSFGLSPKDSGLIDYLTKDVNPKIYSRASKLIDILPTGGSTDESGTLLSSPRMKSLFAHLSHSNYDLIIFDTPPVTRVVDPLVLAQYIKEAIVIVKPGHSLIETVRWGMQELKQANVQIRGIVANAATIESSYYYRYRYGYGYGYGKSSNAIKKNKIFQHIKSVKQTKAVS
jgi:capsular exopolysaccharide synthesis family protein